MIAYRLLLDLSTRPARGEWFSGRVEIALEGPEDSSSVELDAVDLEIEAVRHNGAPVPWRMADRRLLITAPVAGTLTVHYRARVSDAPNGLFAPESATVLYATQLQAAHARRVFPCFDEPARKATFELTVRLPDGVEAIGNMPERSRDASDLGGATVVFERTPPMSTYLFALAVGHFEVRAAQSQCGTPIRCLSSSPDFAGFALETARRAVELFGRVLRLPYCHMLPKLDLVALPELDAAGMENWGAIFLREDYLLVDPSGDSTAAERRVAEVVLHEVAHQWIGDLVTVATWDELWLAEGVVTLLTYQALDALFPDWSVWLEFRAIVTSTALAADSLVGSRPIHRPIATAEDADQSFDAVVYDKAASVLRMLAAQLGADVYCEGLADYVATHSFGSARRADFYAALSRASGLEVASLLDPWVERPGFPRVDALDLGQRRFLIDAEAAPDERPWPLELARRDLKSNFGEMAFCVVAYPRPTLLALSEQVAARALPAIDRYGLHDHAYLRARSGELDLADYLTVAAAYRGEPEPWVLIGVLTGLKAMREILLGCDEVHLVERVLAALAAPALVDFARATELRRSPAGATLLSLLREVALDLAIDDSHVRLDAGAIGGDTPPTDELGYALRAFARRGGGDALAVLHGALSRARNVELRAAVLHAMGALRADADLERALAWSLTDAVRPHEMLALWGGVTPEKKPLAWAFFQGRFREIQARLPDGPALGYLVATASSGVLDEVHLASVESFMKRHPLPASTEILATTLGRLRARAQARSRILRASPASGSSAPA